MAINSHAHTQDCPAVNHQEAKEIKEYEVVCIKERESHFFHFRLTYRQIEIIRESSDRHESWELLVVPVSINRIGHASRNENLSFSLNKNELRYRPDLPIEHIQSSDSCYSEDEDSWDLGYSHVHDGFYLRVYKRMFGALDCPYAGGEFIDCHYVGDHPPVSFWDEED